MNTNLQHPHRYTWVNIEDFSDVEAVNDRFFGDYNPARIALASGDFPDGALVGIELEALSTCVRS